MKVSSESESSNGLLIRLLGASPAHLTHCAAAAGETGASARKESAVATGTAAAAAMATATATALLRSFSPA